jgi:hypothetical protein
LEIVGRYKVDGDSSATRVDADGDGDEEKWRIQMPCMLRPGK